MAVLFCKTVQHILGVLYFADWCAQHSTISNAVAVNAAVLNCTAVAKWLLADTHQAFLIASSLWECSAIRVSLRATHESLSQIFWWLKSKGATGRNPLYVSRPPTKTVFYGQALRL